LRKSTRFGTLSVSEGDGFDQRVLHTTICLHWTYNVVVKRWFLASTVMLCALAQEQPPTPKKQTSPPAQKEDDPPEEDEAAKPKVYDFNPLKSANDVMTGDYYLKKGKLQAAQSRYRDATRYDPGSAEAFLKLGEVDERLKDRNGARAAYEKCAEVASDAKIVAEAKKRLEKLPKK
jgi:tetratricopeptide (TPR) repeat protein